MTLRGDCGAKPKRVVVTGANRGIGLEIVRRIVEDYGDEWTVIMACRDAVKGEAAKATLGCGELAAKRVLVKEVDVLSSESIAKFAAWCGRVDSLVNNAGVALSSSKLPLGDRARVSIAMNYTATKNVTKALAPRRVITVSSKAGLYALGKMKQDKRNRFALAQTVEDLDKIAEDFVESADRVETMDEGFPNSSYGVSKALATAHARVINPDVPAVACCPGLCRTRRQPSTSWGSPTTWLLMLASYFLGHSAYNGADTPAWLACSPDSEVEHCFGKFVRHRTVQPYY